PDRTQNQKSAAPSPPNRQLSPFSPRIDLKNVPKPTGAPNIRKISGCRGCNLRTFGTQSDRYGAKLIGESCRIGTAMPERRAGPGRPGGQWSIHIIAMLGSPAHAVSRHGMARRPFG